MDIKAKSIQERHFALGKGEEKLCRQRKRKKEESFALQIIGTMSVITDTQVTNGGEKGAHIKDYCRQTRKW